MFVQGLIRGKKGLIQGMDCFDIVIFLRYAHLLWFFVQSHAFNSLMSEKKHAVSTTCTAVWKNKGRIGYKGDALRLFIHHSWQPLSIYRQV